LAEAALAAAQAQTILFGIAAWLLPEAVAQAVQDMVVYQEQPLLQILG
jgi:hypothetical protein